MKVPIMIIGTFCFVRNPKVENRTPYHSNWGKLELWEETCLGEKRQIGQKLLIK